MEDAVTSKELPAIFDLLYAIEADPQLDQTIGDLRDELFDEERGFGDLLVTLGDSLEAAKDGRIAVGTIHFIGRELDPGSDLLYETATLTDKSLHRRSGGVHARGGTAVDRLASLPAGSTSMG